ncbi:MAG: antitoxin Xre/MbcA/ParS toxin-binding domain-containing protein [Pseudorhodoplanes sp.]
MNMPFRKATRRPPVSRDVAARQARLLKATQAALVTADATREFLNNEHAALGGRPLDIALHSDAGLLAVEQAIRTEARRRGAAS